MQQHPLFLIIRKTNKTSTLYIQIIWWRTSSKSQGRGLACLGFSFVQAISLPVVASDPQPNVGVCTMSKYIGGGSGWRQSCKSRFHCCVARCKSSLWAQHQSQSGRRGAAVTSNSNRGASAHLSAPLLLNILRTIWGIFGTYIQRKQVATCYRVYIYMCYLIHR